MSWFFMSWFLSGFVCAFGAIAYDWWEGGDVRVKDLVIIVAATLFGYVTALVVLGTLLEHNSSTRVLPGRKK
jgi:undecaprenyl pyrophosphate phosphatase UppP